MVFALVTREYFEDYPRLVAIHPLGHQGVGSFAKDVDRAMGGEFIQQKTDHAVEVDHVTEPQRVVEK
jgi:hypothetical protein